MSKFKELLEKSGISQASLAKKLGISRQQLYSILKDNRKTKYSNQIANLLNSELSNKETAFSNEGNNKTNICIEKLPIVYPEDILRIIDGLVSLDSLFKPFYNQWTFITDNTNNKNHFCMRITDTLNFKSETGLAAFQLFISLKHDEGKYYLVYLHDSKKIVAGSLKIDPETTSKYIVNSKGTYPISTKDVFLAECTQIVFYL